MQAADSEAAQSALLIYTNTVRLWLNIFEGYECQVGTVL